MDFEVGDRIIMKKPHPCGSKEWEVLRVGIDFRIRCCGCDHQIMVPRKLVEKNTKSIKKANESPRKVHGTPIHKTALTCFRCFATLFCSLTCVHFVQLIRPILMQAWDLYEHI